MLTILLAQAALAAELTTLPPAMTGDASLSYRTDQSRVVLEEGGTSVGGVQEVDHVITVGGVFSVLDDLAVAIEIPIHPLSRISYTESHLMGWDPTRDQGTYLGGSSERASNLEGKGMDGVWLGLRGTPLSEARGQRATWLMDLSLRTPHASKNFWVGADKARGAGVGAAAQRLTATFATTRGIAHPYLQVILLRQGALEVELEDGTFTVQPEKAATMGAGTEFFHYKDAASGNEIHTDFRLDFGYHTDGTYPSGTWLPNVLPATAGQTTLKGEHTSVSGTAGVIWRFLPEAKMALRGGLGWLSPTRLEDPYPIYTDASSFKWNVNVGVTYEIRP
jgi:hypothetical protein